MFSWFIRNFRPIEIISYSDLRWNSGKVYSELGFLFIGNTQPSYWYTTGLMRKHRFALKKTELDPTDKTEAELRKAEGWKRIWDCGHSKWVWRNILLLK